ncbi:MAG: hypothetical protein ACKVOR_14630 [Flavobacteriales bacterium]
MNSKLSVTSKLPTNWGIENLYDSPWSKSLLNDSSMALDSNPYKKFGIEECKIDTDEWWLRNVWCSHYEKPGMQNLHNLMGSPLPDWLKPVRKPFAWMHDLTERCIENSVLAVLEKHQICDGCSDSTRIGRALCRLKILYTRSKNSPHLRADIVLIMSLLKLELLRIAYGIYTRILRLLKLRKAIARKLCFIAYDVFGMRNVGHRLKIITKVSIDEELVVVLSKVTQSLTTTFFSNEDNNKGIFHRNAWRRYQFSFVQAIKA